MASTCYNSTLYDAVTGNIDFNTDTFYVMLVGAGYSPDVDAHSKRSSVTANEISGTGYTAGGQAVTCTVTQDNANNRTVISFAQVTWPGSSISAAEGAVYYKRRGGADTADELVLFNDITSTTTSNGTFTLGASTIYLNTPQ